MTNDIKKKCEIEHPIDWSQESCCLCTFLLGINPTTYKADEKTLSYCDFIIFKKHIFLKNIFSSDEIAKTDSLKDLKTFHEQFVRLIKIAVFLRNAFNSCEEFDECFNDDLFDFCKTPCADCSDFAELKDIISDVKIKRNRRG